MVFCERKKKASENYCKARESVFHTRMVFYKIPPTLPGTFPIITIGTANQRVPTYQLLKCTKSW